MNKLLSYYQKELSFLKHHGRVFANRFPKIARRLGIFEGESEDPHVSRLVESFALLTSRIHQRLDDGITDVVDALIDTLAPQFLRPLPSVCIVSITPDPKKSGITDQNVLTANTSLFSTHNDIHSCQFQTIYPVTLLPISIKDAGLSFDSDALCWQLKLCFSIWPGAQLSNGAIRLYLHGQNNIVNVLYTLLCSEIKSLHLIHNETINQLPPTAISPVGFSLDEGLLTREPRIAPIHIILMDYFWFPQKFSFIDINIPDDFIAAGRGGGFEIIAVFKNNALTEKLEAIAPLVDESFFRLHCTPAVNLFSRRAEPITMNAATEEYPIIPDIRLQENIGAWAIEDVSVQRKIGNHIEQFSVSPLIESHCSLGSSDKSGLLWQSFWRDVLGERDAFKQRLFIGFSEKPGRQSENGPDIITVNVLCTNHDLPNQLQYGNPGGDFRVEEPLAGLEVTALTHPTRQISPLDKRDRRLRFLSQLSLNHLLLSGEQGLQRLKEILALYFTNENAGTLRLLQLILDLTCQSVTTRLISNEPHSLARGIDVTVTFDPMAIREPEYYLFCCLLDRLFALYAPVNSFTRLTTRVKHDTQMQRTWPVRAGKLSWL